MKRLILASLVGFAAFTSAHAQTVVNFDAAGGLNGLGGHAAFNYSGQGALSDPGNNVWNAINPGTLSGNYTNAGGTTTNVLTSAGAASAVTLTLGAGGNYNSGGQVGTTNGTPAALLEPFLFAGNNSTVTGTLNNVAAGTYNLFLYGYNAPDGDRGTTFTASTPLTAATSQSTTNNNTTGLTGYILGNNYVEFTGLTLASAGTITFTYTANTSATGTHNPNQEGDFNGLQLQAVVAPEPSTYALMILGFGSLVGYSVLRRRNQSA